MKFGYSALYQRGWGIAMFRRRFHIAGMSNELVDLDKLQKLRRNLGRIPFTDDAIAAYYCAMDPATPTKAKAIIFGALVYFITPTDVIPDILIPGFTDDAAILAAALGMVRGHMTDGHYRKARAFLMQPAEDTNGDVV